MALSKLRASGMGSEAVHWCLTLLTASRNHPSPAGVYYIEGRWKAASPRRLAPASVGAFLAWLPRIGSRLRRHAVSVMETF